MTFSAPQLRMVTVVCGLSLGFSGLAVRLFQLQVVRHDELQAIVDNIHGEVVHQQGRRGEIRDCNGNLMASSLTASIVTADPEIAAPEAVTTAQKLAPLLGLSQADLILKLTRGGRYVRLKSKVDMDTAQRIRAMKLRGIGFEDQFVRSYPNGTLAAHVLGFVDAEHHGIQGIEASVDDYLRGHAGYEVMEHDRKGREIRAWRTEDISPKDGYNVVLTIDQVIQHIAETELDKAVQEHRPRSAMIIVSRPKTGEILAMSCRPTYDPNQPGECPPDARRNRCISDVAEPGSTFKVVSVSGALSEGAVTLEDRFDCENGAWLYAGHVLHDAHPYGTLSVEEILYHSSNIGAAKIAAERMGAARLYEYIRRFGFGRKTGIALPGEVSGIAHPLSDWSKLSVTRIPMGQGIAVTPLQMMMAVNAVANGGMLMRPLIIKSVEDADGNVVAQYRPQAVGRVIQPRASILMAAALRKVVTPLGTAPKAAVPGYDVAGKTGTAQEIENGQYVNRYYASFIGYFPASAPEISILVSLDDPASGGYYGGSVAGPVFRAVAEKVAQYLGIPPQVTETALKNVS